MKSSAIIRLPTKIMSTVQLTSSPRACPGLITPRMTMRQAAPRELKDFLPGKITIRAYIMIAMISTIHLMGIDNSS
jgi:hypothetical protein